MKITNTIRSPFYALTIVAASIVVFVYWQINSYPESFSNITFVFAYTIMLLFISIPLLISENISGFLSKNTLTGSLHYVSRSQHLKFIGLLSKVIGALLLLLVSTRMLATSLNFFYTNISYARHSVETELNSICSYTLTISIIFSIIIIVIIGISQALKPFLKLTSAFSCLGIACLIGLFLINAISFNSSLTMKSFFTPELKLLTSIDVWKSALKLSLFSSLVGLGINSVLGAYFNERCSIQRFSWTFIFSSICTVTVFMLIKSIYKNNSHNTLEVISSQYNYTLNLLDFCMFFFCLLTTAVLLCQTFKDFSNANNTYKWYYHMPLFILLLTAMIVYQHVLTDKLRHIIQTELITNLIFIITYFEILAFGWICDAQNLCYQIRKATKTKLSVLYNLSLRLIAPSTILTFFTHQLLSKYFNPHWMSMMIIFILSLILTVNIGNFLYRRFQ